MRIRGCKIHPLLFMRVAREIECWHEDLTSTINYEKLAKRASHSCSGSIKQARLMESSP